MTQDTRPTVKLSRRTLLRGSAAVAGVAAGSGAVTGFPAVWSAEPKVLRYLGTAVNQSADIAKKVKEDTGITIEYVAVTTDDVTKRVITQPNSYDIVDTEYFALKKLVPAGMGSGPVESMLEASRPGRTMSTNGRRDSSTSLSFSGYCISLTFSNALFQRASEELTTCR